MTTLKFLMFISAFVAIGGVVIPMISETGYEAEEVSGLITATGNESELYVMVSPANYVKTYFSFSPTGATISTLDFYLYADHDVTNYYDDTENYFSFYVDITDPNTGRTTTSTKDNYNPVTMSMQFAYFFLENINLSWSAGLEDDYDVVINIIDDRRVSDGSVYWVFPVIVVPLVYGDAPFKGDEVDIIEWLVGSAVVGPLRLARDTLSYITYGAVSAIAGEDAARALSTFAGSVTRVLTMDFGEIPFMLKTMIIVPLWFCIGYVLFILIRSLIPTLGGGSSS